MSYESIYLISQNSRVVRNTLCCVSGVGSVITCSIYIPANMEIIWGEGGWVIQSFLTTSVCLQHSCQ